MENSNPWQQTEDLLHKIQNMLSPTEQKKLFFSYFWNNGTYYLSAFATAEAETNLFIREDVDPEEAVKKLRDYLGGK